MPGSWWYDTTILCERGWEVTERSDLLASIAGTIQDYRAGEIAEPTLEHVDRWINQFDDPVQVPMLRELDFVLQRTYVSRSRAQQLLQKVAEHYPCDFWRDAHILDIQQEGHSQAEMRELFLPILREHCGPGIDYQGSPGGEFIYLDDAIFTGNRVIQDLTHWTRNQAPAKVTLRIIAFAIYRGGRYWIDQTAARWKSEKEIDYNCLMIKRFHFENRRSYRNQSDVLWPTVEVYSTEGFAPRTPIVGSSRIFSSEEGRQLLEREFLNAGIKIQGFAQDPSSVLKPLGFYRFNPGFGALFVTYRNCPNNCPLALWYGEPERYPPSHPLGRWYPLFSRKTYS